MTTHIEITTVLNWYYKQ